MTPFLKEIAAEILSRDTNDFGNLYVILPNRRSGLFLKKHLAGLAQRPIFSPKILSIEDFLAELGGTEIEDPLYLLFDLYEIHKQHEQENLRSFSEFIGFGEMILHDFNEVDMYLVDTNQFFTWLSEEKAINLWNVDGRELTDYQKNYLSFFNALHIYYEKLNAVLETKQKAYQGKVYRYVAEHVNELTKHIQENEIIFAGFNALTTSEKKIFQFLERSGKAQIYWDTDEYYMDSPIQEAGLFLRKYKDEFKALKEPAQHFKSPKSIEIVGAAENILQAKFAGEKIKEYLESNSSVTPENMVVVLADENLLLPVLNSLPEELQSVNVTMGYSFRYTPIHNFVNLWIDIYLRFERNNRQKFYLNNLLPLLTHPYIQKITDEPKLKSKLLKEFAKSESKKFHLTVEEIENWFKQADIDFQKVAFLFKALPTPTELIQTLENLSTLLLEKETNAIDKEFLMAFRKLILHFSEANEQYHAFDSIKSFASIYASMANKIKIPFFGEPLQGLQIMGLLETRTLDFENVILLSANEGILPKGKKQNSLIPLDIRREFNIPAYRENDAIYGYHFYRLLQRASQITLSYNTDMSGMSGKGEKSRFIRQLQMEMPAYNPSIQINEKILIASTDNKTAVHPINITKGEIVFKRLKERAGEEKGFSPTALNAYISCPLKFYFSEILKIKEPEDLTENIDHKILGTVIHGVLEDIFSPEKFENGKVEPSKIEYSQDEILSLLQNAFEEKFPNEELERGKNQIFLNISKKMVCSFLEKQKELAAKNTIEILSVERKLNQKVNIHANTEQLEVVLSGIADRIETKNGTLRIVDYKTGFVDERTLKINAEVLTNFEFGKINEKLFQLLIYSYLCYKQEIDFSQSRFEAGIYSFRKISSELMTAAIDKETVLSEKEMSLFEKFLLKLLEEIFDCNKPFSQTTDKQKCRYCSFVAICGR